jgi:hypothetical protein
MTFFSRGPNTIQKPYCLGDMYKDYIKDKPEGSPYYVTYKEYVDYCSMFYQMISKAIVDDGYRFKLPWSMGEVFVVKRKTKYGSKQPIDWELTLKDGARRYNFNKHTSGFSYSFFWTRPYKIKNKYMYRLVLTRTNKRYLAKAIKQNKKDYFEK